MSYVAGRVGLVPKGEWNATTQYQKLDIVTYGNKGYIAKVDNIPVGTLPTDSNYFLESFAIAGYSTTSQVQELVNSTKETIEGEIQTQVENIKVNPTFSGSVTIGNRQEGSEIGDNSYANGIDVVASGPHSIAHGHVAKAIDVGDIALGFMARAQGGYAIALGEQAFARTGVAIGFGTYANGMQLVLGHCNIIDTEHKYAIIVGNGMATNLRSNAFAIKWDGTIVTSDF